MKRIALADGTVPQIGQTVYSARPNGRVVRGIVRCDVKTRTYNTLSIATCYGTKEAAAQAAETKRLLPGIAGAVSPGDAEPEPQPELEPETEAEWLTKRGDFRCPACGAVALERAFDRHPACVGAMSANCQCPGCGLALAVSQSKDGRWSVTFTLAEGGPPCSDT